ncbi:MAG: RidA family protein [Terriglobia bacterium]
MKTKGLGWHGMRFVTLAVFLAVGSFQGYGQQRRAVGLPGMSATAPLSPGIVVGNTLYVAGLQGKGPNGKLLAGGFLPQARGVLENIRRVVRKAGFSMRDVVSVNVYLTGFNNFAEMNKLYATYFPDPKPTRTTVQVAALANGALIEMSAIAVKTRAGGLNKR